MYDVTSASDNLRCVVNKTNQNKTKGGLMAEELKAGCARPTGGPVGETVPENIPEIKDEKKYR